MLVVQRAVEAPDAFAEWRSRREFSAVDAHPITGEFGRRYYPAVFGEARRDESFAVMEQSEPLLLVLCTVGQGQLDYFGFPIKLFVSSGLAREKAVASISAAFAQFDDLMAQNETRGTVILDEESHGTLSVVGKECLNRKFSAALRLSAVCDLAEGERGIKRAVRKSYQSLINWGRRNLTMVFVNVGNADQRAFVQYQDFHHRIAGRSTRPQQSWDVMFESIASGIGELSLGFLSDGSLVSGTMIFDGASTAYYMSGVYDRDRFDLPLAHWPIWLAMTRSAERGMRIFDVGDVPLEGAASKKECAIGYFKRGFATAICSNLAWAQNARASDEAPEI